MLFFPTVFFALIISVITTATALLILALSHLNMLKKHNLLLKEKGDLKLKEHKTEVEILEEARQKAAKITKQEFQEQLNAISQDQLNLLAKTSHELLDSYQRELSSLKDKSIKRVSNISKDIENYTVSELKDFKEIMRKETYASQKIVEQKIEKDYQEAKKAIEQYKLDKIKVIEDEIYKILQTVSTLVLGKTLSLQDHESLIIDALNQAKRERII